MREEDILYENGNFWVSREQFGTGRFKPKSNGYAVNENKVTHSVRRHIIGIDGERGMVRAKTECDKLAEQHR